MDILIDDSDMSSLPSPKFFNLLAETFKAMGDPSRVQIIWVLSLGEKSVSEICKQLGMSQPAVSHHLRTLRQLNLIRGRKEGVSTIYYLDDEHIEHLLKEGAEHVEDLMN